MSTKLPARLAASRIPVAVYDWLNRSPEPPFFGLLRRASAGRGDRDAGVIADTSVVKMIEESLSSTSGCLFDYRFPYDRMLVSQAVLDGKGTTNRSTPGPGDTGSCGWARAPPTLALLAINLVRQKRTRTVEAGKRDPSGEPE